MHWVQAHSFTVPVSSGKTNVKLQYCFFLPGEVSWCTCKGLTKRWTWTWTSQMLNGDFGPWTCLFFGAGNCGLGGQWCLNSELSKWTYVTKQGTLNVDGKNLFYQFCPIVQKLQTSDVLDERHNVHTGSWSGTATFW